MLMRPAEIEKKYGLDSGYINFALVHEKAERHFIEGVFGAFYEEEDALRAIRGYMEYQKRLARETIAMWNSRAERLERAMSETA